MFSMTGFGQGESDADGIILAAELGSVNRKQLEIRVNLPPELSHFEVAARKRIAEAVSRGAVSLRLTVSGPGRGGEFSVNRELLELLASEAMALQARFNLPQQLDPAALFSVPGVLQSRLADAERETLERAAGAALDAALGNFLAMREREGAALAADLAARLQELKNLRAELGSRTDGLADAVRRKLLARLEAENLPVDPHDERFQREALFYADRADVTEELTRLDSHFQQFDGFLDRAEPVGRSLDFLIQEMFREITTFGNKAAAPEITPAVIRFKSELEKIREQVQNIE